MKRDLLWRDLFILAGLLALWILLIAVVPLLWRV